VSAYIKGQTKIRDLECLITALTKMTTKSGTELVEGKSFFVHKEAKNLVGYRGKTRDEVANVIIPKAVVGNASNDIGFKREMNGTYSMIISKFDQSFYDSEWQNKLKQAYAEEYIKKKASALGYTLEYQQTSDGTKKLTATRTIY